MLYYHSFKEGSTVSQLPLQNWNYITIADRSREGGLPYSKGPYAVALLLSWGQALVHVRQINEL